MLRHAIVTTLATDAHTWNLVYIQLLLEEQGMAVRNLGSCVPVPEVLKACRDGRPDLLAVSSVHGHGLIEAWDLAVAMRREFRDRSWPMVVGGKLALTPEAEQAGAIHLLQAGYDEVFVGDDAVARFLRFLDGRSDERVSSGGANGTVLPAEKRRKPGGH